jgi:hypothetical protein
MVKLVQFAAVLTAGLAGALAARSVGMPIPFLLGSLAATAALSLAWFSRSAQRLWFPQPLRRICIGTIGAMIGTTFDPAILPLLSGMALSLPAMAVFILAAQGANYFLFRRLGGYGRATAFYSAMPGGLIEAVELGEKAGGNVEILSVQQFARIVLVVIMVPALFFILTGEVVGSAGGQALERSAAGWTDWAAFLLLVPPGIFIGSLLKLPAAQLTGPMLLSALAHGIGVADVTGPQVLLNGAQLVSGAGLGVMFARSSPGQIARCFGLGALSVAMTLGLSAGLAAVLAGYVPMPFDVLLISFAPGGVTEMGLIALSLGASPMLVSAHHLFRIAATVLLAGAAAPRLLADRPPGRGRGAG